MAFIKNRDFYRRLYSLLNLNHLKSNFTICLYYFSDQTKTKNPITHAFNQKSLLTRQPKILVYFATNYTKSVTNKKFQIYVRKKKKFKHTVFRTYLSLCPTVKVLERENSSMLEKFSISQVKVEVLIIHGDLIMERDSHLPVCFMTKISAPNTQESSTRYPLEGSLNVPSASNCGKPHRLFISWKRFTSPSVTSSQMKNNVANKRKYWKIH